MTSQRIVETAFALALFTGIAAGQAANTHSRENAAIGAPTPTTIAAKTDSGSTPSAATAEGPQFQERTPRYRLRPGDVLDLTFEFSPEFNQTAAVQPDGFISLKNVGDIHVSGQTVPELTKTLNMAYGRFLNQPQIAVVLKEFEKPYFIAGGMVDHPGKYELRGDTTLVEAIAMAGGFNEASRHSQVLLFRRVSQEWLEAKVLDVKRMLGARNLSEDVHLQPGDMIYVPQNRISKIKKFIPSSGFSLSSGRF